MENGNIVNSKKMIVNDFSKKNICILLLIFVSLCSAFVYGLISEVYGENDAAEVRNDEKYLDIDDDTNEEKEEESSKYADEGENSSVDDTDSSSQIDKEEMINNDSDYDSSREKRNNIVGRFTKDINIQLTEGEKNTVGGYEIIFEKDLDERNIYIIKLEKCDDMCVSRRITLSGENHIEVIDNDIAVEYSTYYYPKKQLYMNVYYN